MIHQDHRIAVRDQVMHHASQAHDVGGMQADAGFVQHIEHPGGAVAHGAGQLHPLPLAEKEKDIVFHGPAEKKHIFYHNKNTGQAGDLDFTYFNAVYTVENALSKVKDEKGMKRVEKFLKESVCPDCGGTRLSAAARAPRLRGISLDEACAMTLSELINWVQNVPGSLPEEMRPMAESICEAFESTAKRLMDLGLGYLTLDRSASTLSTGERQRMQLARGIVPSAMT